MHGLGNDFIFVRKDHIPNNIQARDFVIKYSDRRTGLGCDQFIFYQLKPDFTEIEIYNADGSEAGACGNATRCIAYIVSKQIDRKKIAIKVQDRFLEAYVNSKDDISVNMGIVEFAKEWMPDNNALSSYIREYLSQDAEFICADIGNRHIIIIDDRLSEKDRELLGPKLEKSPLFPDGVNVNFATIKDNVINLKVWERGAGFTLACGSGACASFASCLKLGYGREEMFVQFKLGLLKMTLSHGSVIMSGPVSLVAEGVLF